MVKSREDVLNLLKRKGFALKTYEDQGLTFYTVTYSDPGIVKGFIDKFYEPLEEEEEEDFDCTGIEFVVEIRDDFETPQWCFANGLEKYHIFDSVDEFVKFVEELPNI
ncbi:hypothetical protein ABE068_24965 [Bacillus glycinifermentans]|uniref:Uncharacterized protein n=1 Tax=Bacillus glycinifermentans TaxID=1664069 RepID=A0A0T6BM32_9BACI|nr:hypothetical protein [Bacillus glycinifermentans]KRT92709.1 hypothetical protein AB447_222275 [Bacillus glycinifermentans]MEC0483419.1 hypothetical protein [Bacillus glycinifermentans]